MRLNIAFVGCSACLLIVLTTPGAHARRAAGDVRPAPELESLTKALSGTWGITIDTEPNERLPKGGKGRGQEIWRPGPGGLSFIEDYQSSGDGEISGIGVFWWDREKARFQVTWCDSTNSSGCSAMKKGAAWKGDDLILEHEWEGAGRHFTMREVFSGIHPNSFTQTLYQGESGKELRRVVTIHANRSTATLASAGGAVAENDVDAAVQAAKTIAIPAIRAHMRFLSDSLLEGRETGSPGHEIAVLYVAAQLESMGVHPAGENGTYFQRVPLRKAINVGSKSSLVLFDRAKEVLLKDEVDYVFGADLEHTESRVEAPVVFLGFGVTAPEFNYDDYAGVDVRGKIVALLANAPARFPSNARAYYADGGLKVKNAVAHGAVGMLGLVLPEDERISPWQWAVPQIQAGQPRVAG